MGAGGRAMKVGGKLKKEKEGKQLSPHIMKLWRKIKDDWMVNRL
jgi:hypothetical protein